MDNEKRKTYDWRQDGDDGKRRSTSHFDDADLDTTRTERTERTTERRKRNEFINQNYGEMNQTNNAEHFGMRFLKGQNVAMTFTFAAILTQAWLFGMLAHREFHSDDIGINSPLWFHIIMAVIFEFTGILIGSSFNNRKIGGEDGVTIRAIWLSVFFGIQVLGDLCLLNVIENRTISTTLVAVSMPIAILAYANLYIAENLKKKF